MKKEVSPVNWSNFTVEYREAVDLLVNNMVKTRRRNFMVFPTIFLFRHYIELMLMEIILNNREYLEISLPFPSGHEIYVLWRICRELMQKTDKLLDPQYAKSQEYNKIISDIEADLKKFAEVDPDSENFRYPVNKDGTPKQLDKKLLIEVLRELPELVKRIGDNLDGISTGTYDILQQKYDALAQQDNY